MMQAWIGIRPPRTSKLDRRSRMQLLAARIVRSAERMEHLPNIRRPESSSVRPSCRNAIAPSAEPDPARLCRPAARGGAGYRGMGDVGIGEQQECLMARVRGFLPLPVTTSAPAATASAPFASALRSSTTRMRNMPGWSRAARLRTVSAMVSASSWVGMMICMAGYYEGSGEWPASRPSSRIRQNMP